MKLRILHLAQFLGVGGLEKVLFLLINEQLQAGHEVELVVYDYEQSWVEYFRKSGIKVDTSFKKSDGYDRKLLKFISQKVAGVDVVHTHDLNPLMYASPVKFLHRSTGRAFPTLIHTAHGMDHLHKRPITKLYEKVCASQTNKTVGVSASVCDYYANLGVNKKKIVNINNGTQVLPINSDTNNQRRNSIRAALGLEPNDQVWINVARVVPLKDQKLVCELAIKMPQAKFLMVGPSGNEEYWNEVTELKVPNVYFLGARSDISDLLIASDYFISASTHEGIPVSVLEAGALERPCLLSDIPGHKLIQKDALKQVAVFFKTGDIDELHAAAMEFTKESNKTQAFGRSLYHHVKENFSSKTMYQKYLELYSEVKC